MLKFINKEYIEAFMDFNEVIQRVSLVVEKDLKMKPKDNPGLCNRKISI